MHQYFLGVANRPKEIFSTGINEAMDELIQYVLKRIWLF